MLVKVGDTIHSSSEEPLMIIVTNNEKELIGSMDPHNDKFCSYPGHMSEEEIELFMDIGTYIGGPAN